MGGKSSSKASTTTSAQDRRIVADNGAVGVNADNSSVSIVSTDHGAIEGAVDLGKEALSWAIGTVGSTAETFTKANVDSTKLAFAFADDQARRADATTKGAAELVQQAFTTANDMQQGNRTLAIAGLVIAGIVGAGVLWNKG
ncbi:MAG TPA: hypothetical protein VGE10_01740 [Zeimonas sp.]